jgi:hypothetical protein
MAGVLRETRHMPVFDPSLAWLRAACAVHEKERQLRAFIAEMHQLADILVIRLTVIARARPRDGVLSYAIQLRDRLAMEAHRPLLLQRWERTFERLQQASEAIEAETDSYLEHSLETHGLGDAPDQQLRLQLPR